MSKRPEKKQVTQADVAEKAGVSRSIVSYVINNGPRAVAADTRQRVLEAIEELDYRPNRHAQMLIQEQDAAKGTKQIGVVISSSTLFKRPYYGTILAGIHEEAHDQHYHIRFIRLFESLRDPALRNQLVHRSEISGLVLLALDQVLQTDKDKQLLDRILERVDNAACIEWHYDGLPTVRFDRHAAAFEATMHLIKLGHTSFAYIGPNDERVRGFAAALIDVQPDAKVICEANDATSGYEQASLIHKKVHLTGIVAGSDEVAFGILKALREHGRRVPEDIALVSIDNIDLAEFASPGLTTVNVPKEAFGHHAVRLLTEPPERQPWSPITIMLPTKLVIRESCGVALNLNT